jgi:hypothetical protein
MEPIATVRTIRPPAVLLSHSSCITLVAQEGLAVALLASPLAYFFISPQFSPFSPPSIVHGSMLSYMSSHMHFHAYVLPVSSYTLSSVECFMYIGAGFGNRSSDQGDPSCPEEGEVRPWCMGRSRSLRDGNVRRATLNALVEESLNTSTEGHG